MSKVRQRADRRQQRAESDPKQNVPRAEPHLSIIGFGDGYPAVVGQPFEQLDYLYTPSQDVAVDAAYFVNVLGATLAFAVEGMGARVAMVQLTNGPPHVLLTDHLEGEQPIFVYRVDDLRKAVARLKKQGLKRERRLELPMGPCSSLVTSQGHRIALYEASRPGVLDHFLGRKDF